MTDDDDLNPYLVPSGPPPPVSPGMDQLINDYADARNARQRADDAAKELKEIEFQYEAKLFDQMEAQGLRAVRHDRGYFFLSDLAWPAMTDVALAREWIDAEMPEILSPNSTKLAVIIRQAVRGEREMPPGMEAKFTRKINWRKS